MFGESDSESPRVPSPWDSLISASPSSKPHSPLSQSPHPVTIQSIPRLIPENDDGNVEYKLQLLNPSSARFTRLVTQLKWRLLEGGGQAYYELGVADSGALVGLPRDEMEQTLETLEMMAGEIGASVIVVKEIEVPAAMAGIAAMQTDTWNGRRRERAHADLRPQLGSDEGSAESSTAMFTYASTTETETEPSSITDIDADDTEDLSVTIVLARVPRPQYESTTTAQPHQGFSVFASNPEPDPDPADHADAEPDNDTSTSMSSNSYLALDLEIATVFKPRPMRARIHTDLHGHLAVPTTKAKRTKKIKHHAHRESDSKHQGPERDQDGDERQYSKHPPNYSHKAFSRRQMRDRKREEKRRALFAFSTVATSPGPTEVTGSPVPSDFSADSSVIPDISLDADAPPPTASEMSALVSGLAGLHVTIDRPEHIITDDQASNSPSAASNDYKQPETIEDEEDVFPTSAKPSEMKAAEGAEAGPHKRLIVEALVVRKMSLGEAFLDFGGFALI